MTGKHLERFLEEFHQKMRVFGVIFMNREKNLQVLADMEISPDRREHYPGELKVRDYFSGPNSDTYDHGMPPYYEFGIDVKGREIYVKISLGRPGKPVLCMSFHPAERPIVYPFK